MNATVVVEGLVSLLAIVTGMAMAAARAGWQPQGVAPASRTDGLEPEDDDPIEWPTDVGSASAFGSARHSDRHRASTIVEDLRMGAVEQDLGGPIDINPASGLPMLNDAFDLMGSPYGFDSFDFMH